MKRSAYEPVVTRVNTPSVFQPEERVGYAKTFLLSVAGGPTSPLWNRRGVISAEAAPSPRMVMVLWDGETTPKPVLAQNIAKVGSAAFVD